MLACAQQPLPSTPEGQSLAAQGLKCPRCDSSDTKFCYYNNYSTAQPRYFCKNCKRYWTEGGSLRNVPVGGGLRKNKKKKMNSSPGPSYGPPSKHQKTNAGHGKERSYANPDSNLHGEDSGYIRNPTSVHSINGSPSSSDPQDASSLNYPISSYPFDLRVYEAGEEASLGSTMQTQFAEGGLFPGYFTGYGYNSGMEGLPQGDFGYSGYKALGSSSSDQAQSSSGELAREPSEVGSEGLNTQPGSMISTVSLNAKLYEHGKQPNEAGCRDSIKVNDQGCHSQPQHVHTGDEGEGKRHATNGDDQFQPSSTDGTSYERGDSTAVTEACHVDVDLDEAFSNVVSVSYPFDWQQVSECLFGGPGDFVYYVVPAGAGGNLSSFDTGAT